MFFPFCFLNGLLHGVKLIFQIRYFFDSDIVNRVLLFHFFQYLLKLYNVSVRLDVHKGGLHLFVSFHEVTVFNFDDLAENSVGVENIEVFIEFLFFDDPARELVDLSLFLVFLNF